MMLATLCFTINDTFMISALKALPTFQVALLRGIFATIACIPLLLMTRTAHALPRTLDKFVLLRALCEVAAVLVLTIAFTRLQIAHITALLLVAPLFLVLGVRVFLKEYVGPRRWILIGIGFVGAMLVAQPGGAGFDIYFFLPILGALCIAARDLVGRRVQADIPGPVVAMTTTICGTIFSLFVHLGFEDWLAPSSGALLFIACAGAALAMAQWSIFMAYRGGDVGVTAPFFYMSMVWALLSGLIVFGTVPNLLAMVGIGLILLSGVLVALIGARSNASG